MTRVFVSYRRSDTAAYTGRVFDRLSQQFGPDQVFMDVEAIAPGRDFVAVLEEAVGSCDALLAVIGPQWLTALDKEGSRRLDDPKDYVRIELAAALDREITVIPLLVGGAAMPAEAELPANLRSLARRNALEISDSRFHDDVDRLIATLRQEVGVTGPAPSRRRPLQVAAAALLGLAAAAAGGFLLWPDAGPPSSATSPPRQASVTISDLAVPEHFSSDSLAYRLTVSNSATEPQLDNVNVVTALRTPDGPPNLQVHSREQMKAGEEWRIEAGVNVPWTDKDQLTFDSYLIAPGRISRGKRRTLIRKSSEEEAELQARIEALEQEHGAFDLRVANALDQLASVYTDGGRFAKAESLYLRAQTIRETKLGIDDPLVALSLYQLAVLYSVSNRFSEAEGLFQQIIPIAERSLGPDHPTVAAYLGELSAMLLNLGRYREAEPLLKRATAIWESAGDSSLRQLLASLRQQAMLYVSMGRNDEAVSRLRRVVDLAARLPPEEGTATLAHAQRLDELAGVLVSEGRRDEAAPFMEQALAIREAKLGAASPELALYLFNLADLYTEQGQADKAERLYARGDGLYKEPEAAGTGKADGSEKVVDLLIAFVQSHDAKDARQEIAREVLISFAAQGNDKANAFLKR